MKFPLKRGIIHFFMSIISREIDQNVFYVKFGILRFCTKNSSNSTKSQNSEFHIKHVLVDFSGNNRHKKVYNTSF